LILINNEQNDYKIIINGDKMIRIKNIFTCLIIFITLSTISSAQWEQVINGTGNQSNDNGISWMPVDENGLVSSINSTIQFTTNYALINTFGIGIYRRNISEVTTIEQDLFESFPEFLSLKQNYPNPFNPNTKISLQSPIGSHQTLKIYDVLGNEVATLVNEYKPAGSYEVDFDANELSSVVYFYKLQAGDFVETKKMILLR